MKEGGTDIDKIKREFTIKLYDFRSRILHSGYFSLFIEQYFG